MCRIRGFQSGNSAHICTSILRLCFVFKVKRKPVFGSAHCYQLGEVEDVNSEDCREGLMRQTSIAAGVLSQREAPRRRFSSAGACFCCFAELHATLEAVRQRHRQRLRLRRGSHVCQRHLRRGQQGRCEWTHQLCQVWEPVRA